MKILHLSDLHIYDDSPLEKHWSQADEKLNGQKFDFIVVSGDLTAYSTMDEYTRVYRFFTETLVEKYLKADEKGQKDRSRLVVVPGNHDVCWDLARGTFTRIDVDHDAWNGARKKVSDPSSAYRIKVEKESDHYELLKISNPADYSKRFDHFETFYTNFYGEDSFKLPSKPMRLTSLKADDDYSLHVFEQEGVIFVGLNSCFMNDCYSQVASFNEEAIGRAKSDIENIKRHTDKEMMLIGVWHHGLASSKGNHDYLDLRDLRDIRQLGLQLGLHGHNHEIQRKLIDDLNINVLVLGAGSLTADRIHKPDGIRNGFTVLNIENSYVQVVSYELLSSGYVDTSSPPQRLLLNEQRKKPAPIPYEPIGARIQRRQWLMDEEGVAHVSVELSEFDLWKNARIPLGYWPSGRMEPVADEIVTIRDSAGAESQPSIIRQTVGGVTALKTDIVESGKYDCLKWSYSCANQMVMKPAELAFYSVSKDGDFTQDLVSHVVEFETMALNLDLLMPPTKAKRKNLVGNFVPMVERPVIRSGQLCWEPVSDADMVRAPAISVEQITSKNDKGKSEHRWQVSMSFTKPFVGYRYAIRHVMSHNQVRVNTDSKLFREEMTSHFRSRLAIPNDLDFERRFLYEVIGEFAPDLISPEMQDLQSLRQAAEDVEMLGLFWCANGEPGGKLCACFGNVPPRRRELGFEMGEGIAGHAFRFDKVMTHYVSPDVALPQRYSKFYSGKLASCQEWIVCVPIGPTKGMPIGVISFSRFQGSRETPFGRFWREFAKDVNKLHENGENQKQACEKVEQARCHIRTFIQAAFWSIMSDTKKYGKGGFLGSEKHCQYAMKQLPSRSFA